MELDGPVQDVQRQLAVAAAGGEEAEALAARLAAPLDAALRLSFLQVLGDAAAELTAELAPGSVEVRLRGGEPELVLTQPLAPTEPVDEPAEPDPTLTDQGGPVARIHLRLPEALKSRVEDAAGAEGLSVNTWLVRAVGAALDRRPPADRGRRGSSRAGGDHFTGWVR